jgi:lipopolysaccharide/colanic/teichoic acid biosynthesis glycosyltransferase
MPGTTNLANLSPAVPARVKTSRVLHRAATRRALSLRLLDEKLFRGALARERRQADRFETTFGLVLVFPVQQHQSVNHATRILGALAVSGGETDVYGWFEQDAVVGAIRWHKNGLESAADVQASVEHDLARSLGDAAAEYRVRSYVYSPNTELVAAPLRNAVIDHAAPGGFHQSAKRALDIAGSGALLLASAPVLLCIAGLVKATSAGPVFFRQQRVGQHGRPFTMLKFRTMRADAAHDIHQQFVSQFIQGDVRGEAGAGAPVFKIVADPRVTRIGHFLRRSSLDELPQFWNVLKGDMSLVGPRPPLPYEVKVYKAWHWRRVLEAKPGITGLWQVTGRSRTTFDEMVRLDIRYARSQSVWTDVRILLATPRAVISGSGAH